jgi:hypothetical protein
MSGSELRIAEGHLHAYVDGQLALLRRAEVQRYLDATPHEARRVAAWTSQREALRETFALQAAAPLPPELNLSLIEALELHLARMHRLGLRFEEGAQIGNRSAWAYQAEQCRAAIDSRPSVMCNHDRDRARLQVTILPIEAMHEPPPFLVSEAAQSDPTHLVVRIGHDPHCILVLRNEVLADAASAPTPRRTTLSGRQI